MVQEEVQQVLRRNLDSANLAKLTALSNAKLHKFVADAILLAAPSSVFVCTDSAEDIAYVRDLSIKTGQEHKLSIEGHTYHFDGYYDQGRDKSVTKYLLQPGQDLGSRINSIDASVGTSEINSLMDGIMRGKEMLVGLFCLGPTDSAFSISCVQITDSAYVLHSEHILYRSGYEQFKRLGSSGEFFRFLHSAGELSHGVSKHIDKKRVYIDLNDEIVYSVNTQYAGNTVGLKKLALRLSINKSSQQGWLAEHMFVMGVHGRSDRTTYFAGAFPSACGKTSTAMLGGQTIIGDDIAFFRKLDGEVRVVNVEKGIFGIIRDVNPDDDPVIYEALHSAGEVIFGNVLVKDGKPYWLGMGGELPESGINYCGSWQAGDKGPDGKLASASHKNARYTISISSLSNRDELADSSDGVAVGGVIYGGRDSDTCVPVEQAFNWTEGIIAKGASLESETTAATIGAEGIRSFNLMSNLDFLSLPLGRYIQNNLDFGDGLDRVPLIFSVNYFLKGSDGNYLNGMRDKLVWLLWAELCVHGEVEKLKSPTGYIPRYSDLRELFRVNLAKDYSESDYVEQFTIRTPGLLSKLDRIEQIYREQVSDTPAIVFEVFSRHRNRLLSAAARHGDYISPLSLSV